MKINLTLLISFTILFTACEKDTDSESKNYLNASGEMYEIVQGALDIVGGASNYDDTILELRFVSSGIDITRNESGKQTFSGSGAMIYFSTSSLTSELMSFYSCSKTEHVSIGTFIGSYSLDYDFETETGVVEKITDGSITVVKGGNEYEITFNCTNDKGENVSGVFSGELKHFN